MQGTSGVRILLSTPGIVITLQTVSQPAFVARTEILDTPFEDVGANKTYAARKKEK